MKNKSKKKTKTTTTTTTTTTTRKVYDVTCSKLKRDRENIGTVFPLVSTPQHLLNFETVRCGAN